MSVVALESENIKKAEKQLQNNDALQLDTSTCITTGQLQYRGNFQCPTSYRYYTIDYNHILVILNFVFHLQRNAPYC